jgi:hypothetical protein
MAHRAHRIAHSAQRTTPLARACAAGRFHEARTPLLIVAMAANVVSQARGKKAVAGKRTAAWENVKSLLGAVLIYLVIKTFLFEAYRSRRAA